MGEVEVRKFMDNTTPIFIGEDEMEGFGHQLL